MFARKCVTACSYALQDGDTDANARFAGTLAVQRYARGLALAALGRIKEAEREQALFLIAKAKVPESRKHLIYNTYTDVLGQCH